MIRAPLSYQARMAKSNIVHNACAGALTVPAEAPGKISGALMSSARAPLRPEFRGTRQKGFQRYPVGTHEKLALRFE